MKRNLFFILSLSFIFMSCNEESIDTSTKVKKKSLTSNFITTVDYDDLSYFSLQKGFVIAGKDGETDTQFKISSENISVVFPQNENSKNFQIINRITGETIIASNIRVGKESVLLDARFNDQIVRDLRINLNPNEIRDLNSLPIGPIIEAIGAIVVAIIDSTNLSPLEQCRQALKELDCASGKSPYMDFDEGWFRTTCKVGCN